MTLLHWLAYLALFVAGYGLGRLNTRHIFLKRARARYLDQLRDHAESVHTDQ